MLVQPPTTATSAPAQQRRCALAGAQAWSRGPCAAMRLPRHGNPTAMPGPAVKHRRGLPQHRIAQAEVDTLLHTVPQPKQSGKAFTWTRAWYPVLPIPYLDPARPTPVTLLGKDLVVWRDGAGEWKCFQDACPHRLAPLSEGRIESDGTLQCSYHGWRFDSSGACTTIPQAEDAKSAAAACSNKRSCVSSYPVRQASGLLWVWPDASPLGQLESAASQPVVPEGAQQYTDAGGKINWYMRDLPYPYETLVENLTDPSHLPYSHHKLAPTLTRDQGVAMPMRPFKQQQQPGGAAVPAGTAGGTGSALESGPQPLVSEQFVSHNSPGSIVEFYPPGMITYRYDMAGTNPVVTQHTHLWAVPTQPGRARVFSSGYNTPFETKPTGLLDVVMAVAKPTFKATLMKYFFARLPMWQRHLFSNKLFDQDGVFLAMQEQRLRSTAASKAASSSNSSASSGSNNSGNGNDKGASSSTTANTFSNGSGASSSNTVGSSSTGSNSTGAPDGTSNGAGSGGSDGGVSWAKEYFMPTSADRAVIQARRWIESISGGPFGLHGNAAAAASIRQTSRRQLMDRYEQHTKHCHFCKAKLKEVESTIEKAPYVGAAFFCLLCGLLGSQGVQGILAGGWPAVAAVVAGVGMAVCATLHKQASGLVDQFKFVDFNHADNN